MLYLQRIWQSSETNQVPTIRVCELVSKKEREGGREGEGGGGRGSVREERERVKGRCMWSFMVCVSDM